MKANTIVIGLAVLAGALTCAGVQWTYAQLHRLDLSDLSVQLGVSAKDRYGLWGAKATVIEAGDYNVLIPPLGATGASLIVQPKVAGDAVIFSRFGGRLGFELVSNTAMQSLNGLFVVYDRGGQYPKIVLKKFLSESEQVWTVNNPDAYGLIEQRVVWKRPSGYIERSNVYQAIWTINASLYGPWSAELSESQVLSDGQGEAYNVKGKRCTTDTSLLRSMGVIE